LYEVRNDITVSGYVIVMVTCPTLPLTNL